MYASLLYQVVFYVLSAIMLLSAAMVVASSNSVRAILFLVLTFVSSAGLWITLQADFLGLILIVVYVGAVMTLFLFVVMMLNLSGPKATFQGMKRLVIFAITMIVLIVCMLLFVVGPENFSLAQHAKPQADFGMSGSVQALGMALYTHHVIAFEMSAIILFVAIVAAIYLTHRQPQNRLKQRVSKQIAVTKSQRLRVIKKASSARSDQGGNS